MRTYQDELPGVTHPSRKLTTNRHDQLLDGAEDAAAQPVLREVTKEALHHSEPRRTGGREVHVKARMSFQPPLHFGMFVSGVVISDQVQSFAGCRDPVDHA